MDPCCSTTLANESFRADEDCSRALDASDPLAGYRERFHVPPRTSGGPCVYLCGNSLGLQPKSVRSLVDQELQDWANLAVDAHFCGKTPWYSYHEVFRESGARLVGALPGEVVMMNSLTVNLHLMMVSFYRPTPQRFKILIDYPFFPSDRYAVQTQAVFHGFDADGAVLVAAPRTGEHVLCIEDIEKLLEREGEQIAVMLMSGVNFVTGQWHNMPRITELGHAHGCVVGWDLAHAAGNVPLRLHEWNVDFAAWCSYKYLNAGPGAVAGCFIHERHVANTGLPRFGGWWGNDPTTRFRMHLEPQFMPLPSADGWQISNPPILAMAPLKASLDIFDEIGMNALREKSRRLTAYLRFLLEHIGSSAYEMITPADLAQRGCQLSLLVKDRPKELLAALHAEGIICDFREPNIVRVAPVPLYNSFHDVWVFADVLGRHCARR